MAKKQPDWVNGSQPLVLTVPEVAALLRVSQRLMYELVAEGGIRSVKIGRRVVIPRSAVDELLAGEMTSAS